MKYFLLLTITFLTLAIPLHAQDQQNNAAVQQHAEGNSTTQATIHQNNTVINNHPTPTPKPVIANENISVSITDNQDTVRPGEPINYRITLRNHLHDDFGNVLIRLQVPRFVIPTNTEPEANTTDPDRRLIEWKAQQISAGSEVTYLVRGNAEKGAPNTDLVAMVLVSGPGVHQTAEDRTTIIDGSVAGTTTDNPPPAPVPVRPTAKTGIYTGLILSILSITVGSLGLRHSLLTAHV